MSRRQTPIALRNRHLPPSTAGGPRPLLLALAMAAGFAASAARAQPTGAQAIHGSAALSQQGSTLLVTTQNGAGSNHSAINWQSFSVPAGTTTHFAQPGATSTSINRVIGPDPSAIFGTLSSNGRLVLVNPAGIAVGAGAVVDTAGFTASTLRMSDADAIAGRLRFGDGSAAGPLRVDGQVLARSGDVVLIGSDVQAGSQAVIQSPEGATVLAAGQKVELTGRGLEGIRFEVQAPSDQAVNLGTLRGDAVGVFAGTLRHSGLVQAQAVSVEGGRVVLKAAGGDALVDGTVRAQAADGRGGSVDVLGERVGLLAGALVDASGANRGGQVRVGGDYQGSNADVPNARRTFVDAHARIQADAVQQGDGGRVIVWSDEVTRMHGQISARGGAQGGDGGFAEVSGKQQLEFTGLADLRAPLGNAGTLLLDPEDITIVRSDSTQSSNTFPVTDPMSSGAVFEPSSAGPVTLTDTHLRTQLESSHVVVKTSTPLSTNDAGQITLMADAVVAWTSGNDLSLQADKGITLAGTIDAGAGGLHLMSLAGDITQPDTGLIAADRVVAQSSGAVSLLGANRIARLSGSASGDFFVKNAQSLGVGDVWTTHSWDYGIAAGSVRLETTSAGADIDVSTWIVASSGSIALDAAGSIMGPGLFETAGGSSGSVRLQARGGDIEFQSIYAYGGSEGAAGGNVDLLASGGIRGLASEGEDRFYIYASGNSGAIGASGGKGGNVTLQFGGALGPGGIYAYGGGGGSEGGTGGRGGTISITRTQGDLELSGVYLDVSGGWSGYGTVGGTGGDGGTLNLTASNGGVRMGVDDYVSAYGGWGGSSDPSTTNSGGRGGRGGSINITAKGASELLGLLDASGGMGGDGDYYGSSRGGTGGDGGAIRIDVSGPLTLAGTLYAGGGSGGEVVGYDEMSYPWPSDPSRAGARGASGSVSTRASGGIVVPDVLPPMETESPMFVSPAPTSSPSPTPPPPALYVDGNWVNESALQLTEGATLGASGPVTNNGSIVLGQGSTFVVGHSYDPTTDTYDFGNGTLTNAAGGLLAGSGTLQGHLVNAGTVAPGGEGAIGTLTVTGDFTQQATGVLLADIAANTTFVPGVTYDQLVMHGAANLGGQLMLGAVPAVATPMASQLAATEPLSTGSLPAPTAYYELLSAGSAGGEFSLISGPPELVSQIRMNVAGNVVPVPGFTALPSPGSPLAGTGLLAAIQEMLPGVSLEQIQQVLTESQNNALGDRRRRDEDEGRRGDILVTDTACQPG